jgi:hypothetical protein
MNSFWNPKKRGVSLPKGAMDLADLLDSAKPITSNAENSDPRRIQPLIQSLLLRSRERHATELLIEPEPAPGADCSVTQRIEGVWCHVMMLPADFRSSLVAELLRMAAFTGDEFPGVGLIALQHKGKRLVWRIDMEPPGSQCFLTPLPGG